MAEKAKKMEKRKKASIFSVFTAALLISVAVGLFMQSSGLAPMSKLLVYAQSNPDSYGNKILLICIMHGETTLASISIEDYIHGMTIELDANQDIYVNVQVLINITLCNSDLSLAIDYTRVYFNISGVCTNEPGICGGSFYYIIDDPPKYIQVEYAGPVWTTVADTTYEVSVKYEAYY